eukprot:CAMPEP_0184497616 /NCGR_PEP_ID=MMETSP0113_2-20130426/37024_1 /TAXON_ID=91329 /ORGANISM="Norrisiella sphaerica, Strain BC52" /LENGTH=56 /DNA_ID=CAMNT_0026884805 /DNA_START=152 /DNA_END=319 /DNA_ORIENTATION=+
MWKVLSKKGILIHHAPSETSDSNGSLEYTEIVEALEVKNEWIRHNRGWSKTLMKKS